MANPRLWISALVVVATSLPLAAQVPPATGSPAKAPPPVAAVTIGVVDLDEAIDRYGWAVRERERLQKLSEQFSAEIDQMTKAVEELRGQLSLLNPGSDKYDQVEFELKMRMNEREGFAALRKRQFDGALEEFELLVYEDLEFVIARVAKDRGVAIVLRAQRSIEFDAEATRDPVGLKKARLSQFNRRTVWYTSPEVDLTPHIITYLQTFDPRAERKAAEAAAAKSAPGDANAGKSQPRNGK